METCRGCSSRTGKHLPEKHVEQPVIKRIVHVHALAAVPSGGHDEGGGGVVDWWWSTTASSGRMSISRMLRSEHYSTAGARVVEGEGWQRRLADNQPRSGRPRGDGHARGHRRGAARRQRGWHAKWQRRRLSRETKRAWPWTTAGPAAGRWRGAQRETHLRTAKEEEANWQRDQSSFFFFLPLINQI